MGFKFGPFLQQGSSNSNNNISYEIFSTSIDIFDVKNNKNKRNKENYISS